MRRHERELPRAQAEDILRNGIYGVLSINGKNDYAYGIPLSYVYIDNSIYLHCAVEGQKLARIRSNNTITFCVVAEAQPLPDQFGMKYKSAIVFGKATEVDEDEKLKALIAFVEKYAINNMEKGREYVLTSFHKTVVLKITIDRISGKARS